MAVLSSDQILALHEAVVRARLTDSRTALLGGIDPGFADSLPSAPNPSAQVLSDLHVLNAEGALSDGSVPITTWIRNAATLATPRGEARVFREMLGATSGIVSEPGRPNRAVPFHVPFLRNPSFVGRDDDLARLHDLLQKGG